MVSAAPNTHYPHKQFRKSTVGFSSVQSPTEPIIRERTRRPVAEKALTELKLIEIRHIYEITME